MGHRKFEGASRIAIPLGLQLFVHRSFQLVSDTFSSVAEMAFGAKNRTLSQKSAGWVFRATCVQPRTFLCLQTRGKHNVEASQLHLRKEGL